jgi:glycosyltransferase involved in cell wall biosynthesis
MKFEELLLSLAKKITTRFHYSTCLKNFSRRVASGLGILEEHHQVLMAANIKTHKWMIEYAAEVVAPVPVKTPLVSIVMPTWNRGEVIERAIKSVLNQQYQNWELIIVDDGSTDGTQKLLEKYLHDKRIRSIYQDHRGCSVARNRGLADARGEYIAYVDSDVEWFPGYLSNVVDAFVKDEELDAVYTAQLVEDLENSFSYVRCEDFDYGKLCRENYIDLNVFAHRRRLYESEGGFDENLDRLIDWDLIRRYGEKYKIRRVVALGGYYSYGRQDQITRMRSKQHSTYLVEAKYQRPVDEPIRVLYALWHYPQLSESYVRSELRGVLKLGVEVEVWSEHDVAAAFESEVPVHRGSLEEVIARFKPHAVHSHWLHIAEQLRHRLKAERLPLTVRGHGFEFSAGTVAKLEKDKSVQGIYIFPHYAERCKSSSGKVHAMPIGFDPELYPPGKEKDRRFVMRTAAGLPTKDLKTFFKTAKLCPNHHFMLVVCHAYLKESYLDEIFRMNESLGNPAEIRVDLQHEEVAELMGRAGIYLHTADPNEPFGMPISISEAMATGSYLIGRRLPPSASYIAQAGQLYDTPEEAAYLIRETEKWTDQEWEEAYVRSVDRAYQCFVNVNVYRPLVDQWLALRHDSGRRQQTRSKKHSAGS